MTAVTIIAGSNNDRPVVDQAVEVLKKHNVSFELHIASAHRDPRRLVNIIQEAEKSGCHVFIAAAGMAAHLAGTIAANTTRPVIGIPIGSGPLSGWDSLLSTAMMPPGIPVATVAVNGAKNAAVLALQILSLLPDFSHLKDALENERVKMRETLIEESKKWKDEMLK